MRQLFQKPMHRYLPPLAGVTWVLGCGLIDWWTGPELALSAFYLPGIILTAWFSGRTASVWVAVLAAAVWLKSELLWDVPYSHPLIPFWNALVRLVIFGLIALLASEINIRKRAEAALRDQTKILSSILDCMHDGVVVLDKNQKIILSNPAAHRFFGDIPLNESAGAWIKRLETSLCERPANPDKAENKGFLHQAVNCKKAEQGEISLRGDSAENPLKFGIAALPLMEENQAQSGVVLVISDLTAKRKLERQISQASESEQRRIGQDLHDGVCQHFAGVAFAASTLQSSLEQLDMPAQAAAAGEIAELVRDGINQARSLARGLYPTGIEEGLQMAMASLASNTRDRSGVECEYVQVGGDPVLSPASAGHLYRIAQEAVINAVRHAQAREIGILLSHQDDLLTLEVSDDGRGIGTSRAEERGIGLQIMRYRANLIGAQLEVFSRDGEGTSIRCKLSLPET